MYINKQTPVIGVISKLEVKVTDPKDKQRISIYIDRAIVKKADDLLPLAKCSSRNEFVAKAIERYVGELALGSGNSFVTEALTESIQKACADSLGNISNAMFRYAVYADMMVRLVASCMEVEPYELDEIQRKAYNNVRRTRGKISLEETLRHTQIKENENDY